ncbi:MAG: hypothetical protein ACRYF0_08065 [Janthinobacterium lividum]
MRNPFGRPYTLWQWWLGSLCWIVAVVSSWLLFSFALLHLLDKIGNQQQQDTWAMWGIMSSLGVAQVLVTWAAWRRPATYPAIGRANWPALLMLLWRMGLAGCQVAWLGYTIIVVGYAMSGPAHPPTQL